MLSSSLNLQFVIAGYYHHIQFIRTKETFLVQKGILKREEDIEKSPIKFSIWRKLIFHLVETQPNNQNH